MDYSSPWTPELDRIKCKPCALYGSVGNAIPNSIQHPAWAKSKLNAELDKMPEARYALWESILMLWRLSKIAEDSREDLNWQKLVSAWLHRHRDICLHFHIAPYEVVSNYATTLRAAQLLPLHMIPSWDQSTPIPSSDLEQPPNKPRRVQRTKRKPEARMTPSNARGSRDVEMAELVPPITRSTRKRKQQSEDDISISVEGSQVEQSDTRKATSEIGPQEPPQVPKRPKRLQETSAPARPEEGLDLSKYEFEERSRIGRELPMAEGKICSTCSGESSCQPIWCKGDTTTPISCELCLHTRADCSFKRMNWGVKMWPTVKPKPSLVGHLQMQAAKVGVKGPTLDTKGKGRAFSSIGGRKDVFQDILSPPRPTLPPNFPTSVPNIAIFPPSNPPASSSQPPPHTPQPCSGEQNATTIAMLSTKLGFEQSTYFQPYVAFEDVLWDDNSSPLDSRMAAVMVDAVRCRERGDVEGLIRLAEGREAIADNLIDDLLEKADRDELRIANAADAARKDTEVVESGSSRDDGSTTIEVTRVDAEGVEDLLSVNQAAMEGVESELVADTETTLNRDEEDT